MLFRVLLILALFGAAYWILGTFAYLRRRGHPSTLRLVLALIMAGGAIGVFPFPR